MGLNPKKRQALDQIFKQKGYTDYKWIDPIFDGSLDAHFTDPMDIRITTYNSWN